MKNLIRLSWIVALLCVSCGMRVQAQIDPQAEKGDAIFRDLFKVGINVGHTAIYYGYYVFTWDGQWRHSVIQASGTGSDTPFAVAYRPFDYGYGTSSPTFMGGLAASAYWGAGNRSTLSPATWNGSANSMSAARRDAIITEAQQLIGTAYCWYWGIWEDYYGNDASVSSEPRSINPIYPYYIRCDGVVQWVYERVGFNMGDRTIDLFASPYPRDRAGRFYVASVDIPSTILQDSSTSFTITTSDNSSTPTIVEVIWGDNSTGLYYSPLKVNKTTTATISYRGDDLAGHTEAWKQFSYVRETTPPTVAITNPAANARFTNSPLVAVQGTAADNLQVAAVGYQLNGGGWNPATGTTNWQITVTLPQGTNVFQVVSVDSAGNNSLTNTRNFVLVLTTPIVVQTNGVGTVSPNHDGQMLEIGTSYSMTASAGAGFMFTNWTGSVPTNGPTVKFIMASNLVLTANFVDITKPTVSLTNVVKIYTNSQTVTIAATASDNVGVTNVEFYDGGILKGSDTTPTYTFDWSFTNVDNGAHVWTARAYDAAGNVSTSSAVTLTISIDVTPPTLVISSPTNGANVTVSPTTVSGTASDPGSPTSGLNLVEVRVNGGSWSNATGTASWTRSVTLSPCANTIEARSRDKAGNYSAIASNLVTYISPNTPPNTPSNVSPANGAANVSVMPTLHGSVFSDADCVGDTHAASQWQVLNSPGAVVVADSGTNTVNTVSWLVPTNKLYYGSNYQWHVRYQDSRNGWSSYSPKTSFTNGGPVLIGTKQGRNMVFKWPTNAPGFALQWVPNLGLVNWSNAAPSPAIVSGQYTVTNSMTNNVRFYRLKK